MQVRLSPAVIQARWQETVLVHSTARASQPESAGSQYSQVKEDVQQKVEDNLNSLEVKITRGK